MAEAGAVDPRTEEEKKYDRQIRLWGGHGQKALAESKICCLGSGPTASETLKNLVLPGVGHFTIVDDAVVTEADVGNNFFVDEDSIGKSRAEVVKDFLLEMNPEIKGAHVKKNIGTIINDEIKFFDGFTLVLVAAPHLAKAPLLKLAEYLYAKHIPLIVLKSYGLLGSVRVALPDVLVTESHPEDDRYDLYLHPKQIKTFPELEKWLQSFPSDLSKLTPKEHGEVPFPVILYQHINAWCAKHDGKVPEEYEDIEAFKKQLEDAALKGDEPEDNFHEALVYARQAYRDSGLHDEVKEVLAHEKADEKKLTADSPTFWVLVVALKQFIEKEGKGHLPCSPVLPDMTTNTDNYVQIQEIFKARAERDQKVLSGNVKALLKKIGAKYEITETQINLFLKNFRGLYTLAIRPLAKEYSADDFRTEDVNETLEEVTETAMADEEDENSKFPNPNLLHWYFGLRAAEEFFAKNGRYPGVAAKGAKLDSAADLKALTDITANMFKEYKITAASSSAVLQEIVRSGGEELHNIASWVGGIGSQEALKFLIGQYVPCNNTIIVNGVHGSCGTFEL